MPNLTAKSLIPVGVEELFEYVTGFPVNGGPDAAVLQEKYGRMQKQDSGIYFFREEAGGGATWECSFDPPKQRVMQTFDSSWSNRTDYFEPAQGGTLWTIVWEPKGRGMASISQWLAFHLRHRRQVRARIIFPVLLHFTELAAKS